MAQPCYATSDCSQICLNMHTQRWCETSNRLSGKRREMLFDCPFSTFLASSPLYLPSLSSPLSPPLCPPIYSLHSQQCCGAWCRKPRCHTTGNFTGTDPPRLSLQNYPWVCQHTHTHNSYIAHYALPSTHTHTPTPSQVSLNSFSGNGWMVATLSA